MTTKTLLIKSGVIFLPKTAKNTQKTAFYVNNL